MGNIHFNIVGHNNMTEVKYYRVPEASKAVSMSESHLWNLIREGVLSVYKTSDRVTLLKAEELFAYIESFKVVKNGKN